ncbi:related to recQ gene for DNA helicase [Cephalotrichum gorgonifer]|uniref:ATP-dependent DNA helicase n=1 Tax=Cephalotrichum gorgonifer TaxID=2041049 RepID=A0AAE8N0T4_9PEZI|nr:related to recQ gene for DNA helicase [Cephalotrichum gorgonifer]
MSPRTLTRTESSGLTVDIGFTLRRQFNKESFRPYQKEIIEATLEGHDVYVQAATSFGKSLCFQLPAVIESGITIVVSPLLSLMMNQVEALRKAGIDARTLNSTTSISERDAINKDLESGHPFTRLLYVTPELCSTDRFRQRLQLVYKQRELARIAIDEAHCISEWGHDFRKDFKRLSWFRETFPDVPIMCLTATANEQIRNDVLSTMGLSTARTSSSCRDLKLFTMTAHRPNLHLEIKYTQDQDDNRLDDFVGWLNRVYDRRRDRKPELDAIGERVTNVPGIIYTMSRNECESLSGRLREVGIGARPFHARLSHDIKEETLNRWINNEEGYDIIVATTAFGMGIDKDNVRFVVHWRLPKSFEGYYQEVGRAGRDGKAGYCFLYYSREDLERVQRMLRSDGKDRDGTHYEARMRSLQALALYAENTSECRHAQLCSYFGEEAVPYCELACDWHKDPRDLKSRFDRGLATTEWVSTQAENLGGEGYYDD